MPRPIPAEERDRVLRHYAVECALADRLRESSRDQRGRLYGELYDELFRRVPDHPLSRPDLGQRLRVVEAQCAFLRPLVAPTGAFLEIGAGDCRLAVAMAAAARQVYAVDVSAEIAGQTVLPANCQLLISDGCTLPLPSNSVSLAFSDQLMEHLHPADAEEQLREVQRVLAPGGTYVLFTPNRLSGPHDVSKYFDPVARGFHLKEYTTTELAGLMRATGFRRVYVPLNSTRGARLLPVAPVCLLERLAERVPADVGPVLAGGTLRRLFGRIAAVK